MTPPSRPGQGGPAIASFNQFRQHQDRTADGVVTVSGIAKNVAEKTLVSKLATDITGVKSVVNNMTVAPTA